MTKRAFQICSRCIMDISQQLGSFRSCHFRIALESLNGWSTSTTMELRISGRLFRTRDHVEALVTLRCLVSAKTTYFERSRSGYGSRFLREKSKRDRNNSWFDGPFCLTVQLLEWTSRSPTSSRPSSPAPTAGFALVGPDVTPLTKPRGCHCCRP